MSDVETLWDLQQAIKAKLVAEWIDDMSQPLTPLKFGNENFKEPASGSWAELFVEVFRTGPTTFGNTRRFERRGLFRLRISSHANEGEAATFALMDKVLEIFEGKVFDGITVYETNPKNLGTLGNLFVVVVESLFWYDVIK